MSSKKARQLCPGIIFRPPRFDVYKTVSSQVRRIFQRYTGQVEPLSLDEAYLDVTEDIQGIGSAIDIARQIKHSIREELGLTASAGVSVNKFAAKIASAMQKPDGLTFIGPSKLESFVEQLAVEKFFGVGKVTAGKMKNMGLHTGADIKKLSVETLVHHFGKAGRFYYQIVRGIDDRPVQADQDTKSIGAEDTFQEDLTALEDLYRELDKIALVVQRRLQEHKLKGRTLTLKIKYSDFKQITRSRSFAESFDDLSTIVAVAKELLFATYSEGQKIRLLGVTVSNFGGLKTSQQQYQLNLFE
jgi:DNA polymerase-4